MSAKFRMEFDPKFIEESVFLMARCYEEEGKGKIIKTWNAEREKIYEICDVEKRENAFIRFYEKAFIEWGIQIFFNELITSFPMVKTRASVLIIQRAFSRKEEGSELYIKNGFKTIVIMIQVIRLKDLNYAERFLKHELLRMSDMLDPAFEYSHDAVFGKEDEIENNLIRDRYRILWDLFISSRLLKKGFNILLSLEQQKNLMDKAFLKWSAEIREKIFWEVQNRSEWTQAELLRLAEEESHDFARA